MHRISQTPFSSFSLLCSLRVLSLAQWLHTAAAFHCNLPIAMTRSLRKKHSRYDVLCFSPSFLFLVCVRHRVWLLLLFFKRKKKRITRTTCLAFTPQLTSLSFTTPPFLFICFSWLGSTSQSYKQAHTHEKGAKKRERARKEHKKAFRSHKLDFLINTYF